MSVSDSGIEVSINTMAEDLRIIQDVLDSLRSKHRDGMLEIGVTKIATWGGNGCSFEIRFHHRYSDGQIY